MFISFMCQSVRSLHSMEYSTMYPLWYNQLSLSSQILIRPPVPDGDTVSWWLCCPRPLHCWRHGSCLCRYLDAALLRAQGKLQSEAGRGVFGECVHVQVCTLCTVHVAADTCYCTPHRAGAGREIRTAGNFTFYTSAILFAIGSLAF